MYLDQKPQFQRHFQALLLEIVDKPIVEREEEATTEIQRIIKIEAIHVGWKFIGQVLGKKIYISE